MLTMVQNIFRMISRSTGLGVQRKWALAELRCI